jgi:two-component system cell cycle response regulator
MSRFLVVEDNPENLDLMVYLLRAFGHTVEQATDGEKGVTALAAGEFDIVVCDLQLPVLSGFEVLERIRADPRLRGMRVIAVTALAMVGDRERILARGFDGYLAKPIDPRTFVKQLESFLPGSESARAAAAPSAAAEPEAPAARAPSPELRGGRRVLVVDDLPQNRDLLRCILEPNGFEVHEAGSVAEGMARLPEVMPAIVLCDFHMPGAKGHEMLTSMRRDPSYAAIPFLILSSTVWREEDRKAALALGAARFLMRPIEAGVLVSTVEQVLADTGGGAPRSAGM